MKKSTKSVEEVLQPAVDERPSTLPVGQGSRATDVANDSSSRLADLLVGHTPEQRALIAQFKEVSRRKVLLDEAAEAAAESLRRLQTLGFWGRLYVDWCTRWWSTVAWALFPLSEWLHSPWLRGRAMTAGRNVLQPPSLYPEFRAALGSGNPPVAQGADATRKAAALRALADEIRTLPTEEGGRLSLTTTVQVHEIARRVDNGADEAHVREAMKRIREGETLAETLSRR